MPNDKYGGLTRDARDRAVQELIRYEIADYHYAAAGKSFGMIKCCHNSNSKAERPKAVNAFSLLILQFLELSEYRRWQPVSRR